MLGFFVSAFLAFRVFQSMSFQACVFFLISCVLSSTNYIKVKFMSKDFGLDRASTYTAL